MIGTSPVAAPLLVTVHEIGSNWPALTVAGSVTFETANSGTGARATLVVLAVAVWLLAALVPATRSVLSVTTMK